MTMKNLNMLVAGAALAIVAASPAYAALHRVHSPYEARAQVVAPPSGDFRAQALRQCTEISRKYAESTWGNMQIQQQRTCMAEHGQFE